MQQQGQVFPLAAGSGGEMRWAYRYRVGGRGSRRVQRGGFATEQAAVEALERVLERLRRERGLVETPTLAEFVDIYLRQHGGEPETVDKLRWLLTKSVRVFGERRLGQLCSPEIAAWRMTIPVGHRFEATQALRQVLNRAVDWGLVDVNPAKTGVDNPQRRRTEKRPFESWEEVDAVAAKLSGYGPLAVFAAATGLRPGEWLALEWRDVDCDQRVVYVRRSYRNGRVKYPKTETSMRAVPLQALRAGISTFDLSRYMGASLTMIDRHYGHLARDGREHAIQLLDAQTRSNRSRRPRRGRPVDVDETLRRQARQRKQRLSRK